MKYTFTLLCSIYWSFSVFSQKAFSDVILDDPRKYTKDFEAQFLYKEVLVYIKNPREKSIIVKNDYASAVLNPPIVWPLKLKQYYVKEIRVIFTKYPLDKSFWNTNYYELLARRLRAVFIIDPQLNDESINYTLVLQTQCTSEEEAKKMLHGIEIVYEAGVKPTQEEEATEMVYADTLETNNSDSLNQIRDREKAYKFYKKAKTENTLVIDGLHKISQKDSLLIVIDCTGSMAPYYSQVSLWASENFSPSHYYVMFNDAGSRLLPLGKTGGYEDGRVKSVLELIKLLKKASGPKGANKEQAENVVEGILAGVKAFPDNNGIILIADNLACVRDYKLLGGVDKPINIIPCGGTIINPLFLNMACYTGGSVFWNNEFISNWAELCTGDYFRIGDFHYRYLRSKQQFEAVDDKGFHYSFCDGYSFKQKKKKKN